MWRWLRNLTFRGTAHPRPLRAVCTPAGDPYRDRPGMGVPERDAAPRTLDEVFVALRDAELAFRPRRRGFELLGTPAAREMPVRVADPTRVVPGAMACAQDAPELLIDLGLALVPLFGPLLVDIPFAGTLFVDGSRDRRSLGTEAAERIQSVSRRVATRAPISAPLLIDLARRMRHP